METPIIKTESDIQRKTVLMTVINELDQLQITNDELEFEFDGIFIGNGLTISELSEHYNEQPIKLFETVREALAENETVNQAIAHAKTSGRIKTEFAKDDSLWYTDADMVFLDFILLDALSLSDAKKLVVIHHCIQSYARGLKLNKKMHGKVLIQKVVEATQ
jgi:hypothetical protein